MDDNQNNQSGQNQKPSQQAQEQTLVQFPKNSASANPAPGNQSTSIQEEATTQVPQQPQGGIAKEQEPITSSATQQPEWVSPSEKAVELEPEVKSLGVKETVNEPKLTTEDKIAGLQEAMESIPVGTKPVQKIKYPIDLEDAEKTVKGSLIFKNTGNAMLWLALLILRQFKMKQKQERE